MSTAHDSTATAHSALEDDARVRLRRIEGQVRGLQGMLADVCCDDPDGEPCNGMLTQVLAVRAAVEQVGLIVMQLHLRRCVLDDAAIDDETMKELSDALRLWSRLSSPPR